MQLYRDKKFTSTRIWGMLFALALVLGSILISPRLTANADTSDQRVYDNAGLLNSEEITSLEAAALEIGTEYNTKIYILTDVDSDGKSLEKYIEDFADSVEVDNSTIIFVNMESGNRGAVIQGYGKNEHYINGSRIESLLLNIKPYLQENNYYLAFTTFLDKVNYYLGKDPSILSQLWFQVIIALIVGGATVGIMAANSGGRVTVNESTYLDSNHSRLLAHHDNYIRTTTTRVKKPDNNSSGGNGGGTSSGGRSHSGAE